MKAGIALTLLAAAIWLLGGTWYYDCRIKRVCGPAALADIATTGTAPQPARTAVAKPTVVPASSATPSSRPAGQTAPSAVRPVVLTVRFDPRSSRLLVPPQADAVVKALRAGALAGHRVRITGHSDGRGTRARIALVSRQRAEALRDWLVTQGLPAAQLETDAREDREPLADNRSAKGRALNRRAVATLE